MLVKTLHLLKHSWSQFSSNGIQPSDFFTKKRKISLLTHYIQIIENQIQLCREDFTGTFFFFLNREQSSAGVCLPSKAVCLSLYHGVWQCHMRPLTSLGTVLTSQHRTSEIVETGNAEMNTALPFLELLYSFSSECRQKPLWDRHAATQRSENHIAPKEYFPKRPEEENRSSNSCFERKKEAERHYCRREKTHFQRDQPKVNSVQNIHYGSFPSQ